MTQDQDNSEQTTQETKKTRKTSTTRKAVKRAAPLPEDEASAAAAAETVETPAVTPVEAPKKTTRRRAVKAVEASSSAEPTETADQAGAAPVLSSKTDGEADPVKPKTPRRSRVASRKAVATEADEADASAAAAPAAMPVPAETEAAPAKPARRRTKKAEAAPESVAPALTDEPLTAAVTANVTETAPVAGTRARGRSKSRTAAPRPEETVSAAASGQEVPVGIAHAEAAPAPEEDQEDVAAPRVARSTAFAGMEIGGGETDRAPVESEPVRPIAPPARPTFEDDGVVTHILPLPADQEGDGRSRRRRPRRRSKKSPDGQAAADFIGPMPGVSIYDTMQPVLPPLLDANGEPTRSKRHRSRRKRKPGGTQAAPFQPEAFADMYPSAVLGVNDTFTFSDDFDEVEDDGPQPALPGQPSLALPPAPLEDEDLEALDEAVNGNRVDAPRAEAGRGQGRRGAPAAGRQGGSKAAAYRDAEAPAKASGKEGAGARAAKDAAEPAPSSGKRVLYMSVVPDEQVEVVITDNGQVTEYFVEMAHQAKIRGNIYKGIINNVDTNLQAAFVNFGCGKNGFLQIDEVHPEYWLTPHDATKGPKYPPIQKVLKVGQEVLVQVVKEPSGSKGAFLTSWVSLAGRFLVLTPGQEQIGVSRKVEDPEERTRLKELLAGIEPGEDMGVIIRTASEGASKTSIQKDLQFLKRLWKDIRKRATTEKAPCLIYQEADLASRAVRDYLAEDIQEIWVDNDATQESIRETISLLFPRRQEMVKLHQDPRQTLWERFNLQRQLEEVTSREVVLPSGGRLVFDQTEALMAIDINSGKTQGKSNFEAMVFRTNMEAAEAIARHLRLRDIGGQVVIDFIEMRDRNHCRDVEKTLRNAMRLDRARHDVGRMSSFGLLELVRQRTGTSAISISSEPCPYCRGTGVRRNMEWQALHAMRDLQCKLSKNTPSDNGRNKNGKADAAAKNGGAVSAPGVFVYEAEPELGLYLLNKKRDRLLELENRFGVHIEIRLKACNI